MYSALLLLFFSWGVFGRMLIRFPLRRGVKSGKAKQEGGSFPLKVDIKTGIGVLVEEREREKNTFSFQFVATACPKIRL